MADVTDPDRVPDETETIIHQLTENLRSMAKVVYRQGMRDGIECSAKIADALIADLSAEMDQLNQNAALSGDEEDLVAAAWAGMRGMLASLRDHLRLTAYNVGEKES
jgi:hypothetical protein